MITKQSPRLAVIFGIVISGLVLLISKRPAVGANLVSNLSPSDDAYINASSPTANYGTATTLKVSNGSPVLTSYLKFNLASLAGQTVTSAKLQIYATNGSALTESVKQVTGSWSESTLNYNNKPTLGSQIATINPISTNATATIDLTNAVATNVGNQLSLEIDSPGSDSLYFNSKENSSNPPVLVVTYTNASPTPSASPSPSPSVSPTPLPSASPKPSPTPLPSPTVTPTPSPTPIISGNDPVIVAAGDIACDPTSSSFNGGNGTSGSCHMKATSQLIGSVNPTAVLALGDNQYYCGSLSAFQQSYALSWGNFKAITHPTVGNHEYLTSGASDCTAANANAAGYYTYYGAAAGNPAQGYYSYDIGTWHLISLNTQCSSAGGCGTTSPQYKWLQSDLAAHTNFCTLAYYHIPLFSSGGRANANSKSLFQLLYTDHADVVLNGHDHIYERFAPQDANGVADPVNGITEIIAGTGGADHTSLATIAANSVVRNTDTFGVLKMTLHPTSYDWTFIPEPGKTFTDSGTANCH